MALFSFKRRFVAPILAGTKRQTIRARRKALGSHGREGGPITLQTGSRFKPEPLGRSLCTGVMGITLNLALGSVDFHPLDGPLAGKACLNVQGQTFLDAFAVDDGFADWADLCAFWAENHPGQTLFSGIITKWGDLIS